MRGDQAPGRSWSVSLGGHSHLKCAVISMGFSWPNMGKEEGSSFKSNDFKTLWGGKNKFKWTPETSKFKGLHSCEITEYKLLSIQT
jgi:hypothetical protein